MRPQILLTFANPSAGKRGFLRKLRRERGEIERALRTAKDARVCGIDLQSQVTRAGLIDHLQAAQTAQYAVVFHYGGHASGDALALGKGDASADGVAALLGALPRLHLVFLNGCSTDAQAQGLLDCGVSAVIATRADVVDAAATDFAIHFYRRLGEGVTLREAFDEAVAAVKTLHAVLTMDRRPPSGSSRRRKKTKTLPGVPWQLHSRRASNAADPLEWSLPLAADDPLFVLPRPASMPLDTPYRGAEPYRVEDAAMFFGRAHEIRAAYDALMAPRPVVLHGPRGVGRTSVIQAGLLARLHERRAIAATPSTLPEPGRFDVVLIDDAERLSDAQVAQALALAPAVLFAVESAHQSRIEVALTLAGQSAVSVALAHLDAQAIRRVIEGPARLLPFTYTPQLPTRLVIDLVGQGVAAQLSAVKTLVDVAPLGDPANAGKPEDLAPQGATTPIVSAVLTALWMGRLDGTISDAQYEMFKSGGGLNAVIDAAFGALAARRAEWIESGFALEVLAHHTTLLGTAHSHSPAALKARYAHRDDLDALVKTACARWLLVRTDDGTALAHDLLAPLIGSRFATSRAPAQQARRIVEERLPSWADGTEGVPLDAADLAVVVGGRASMPALNTDGVRLIEASAAAVRARARRTRIARITLIVAALVIIGLAFVWQKQRSKTKLAASEAKAAVSKKVAAEAKAEAATAVAQAAVAKTEAAKAKAKAAEAEAQVARTEAQLLKRTRDLSAGLVEAYRKIEDADPRRAHQGVIDLARLVDGYGELVPEVAQLALRAWSGVLSNPAEAQARMPRPNVVGRGSQSQLIDLHGRAHPLASPPDMWFAMPTGRMVAIYSEAEARLRVFDAQTGAEKGSYPIANPITAVVQFHNPHLVIVASDLKTVAEEMRLLVLDARTGAGETLLIDNRGWLGDCATRINANREIEGQPTAFAPTWFQFQFDDQGRLKAAPPTDSEAEVDFEGCIRHALPTQTPAARRLSFLEPAWRRWTSVLLTASSRQSGIEGEPAIALTFPADPREAAPWGPGMPCVPACDLLEPKSVRRFEHDNGAVLAGLGQCADVMHSPRVVRICRARESTTAPLLPAAKTLILGSKPPDPRRRGDHLLIAGQIFRLSDLAPVPLDISGVPRDFAVSPSGRQLVVLTGRRMVLLAADEAGEFEMRGAMATDAMHGPALRAQFIDEARLVVQRARDVLTIAVDDHAVIWRRAEDWHRTDRLNAGLAVGDGIIAVRRGDSVRQLAAVDGTPLTPVETVDGLSHFYAAALRFDADGALHVQDTVARFSRQPMPKIANAAEIMRWGDGADAFAVLKPVQPARHVEHTGPRCPAGSALRDAECWPAGGATSGALLPNQCAQDAPRGSAAALLGVLVDHLVTECDPQTHETYGCGILYGLGESQPAAAKAHRISRLKALAKMLLNVPVVRKALVGQAAAWIKRCRRDDEYRLSAALAFLDRALTVYTAQADAFEGCEKLCEPLELASWATSAGLDPDKRETDRCFRNCRTPVETDEARQMREVLRFIHRRVLQGISVAELRSLLGIARSTLNWN